MSARAWSQLLKSEDRTCPHSNCSSLPSHLGAFGQNTGAAGNYALPNQDGSKPILGPCLHHYTLYQLQPVFTILAEVSALKEHQAELGELSSLH